MIYTVSQINNYIKNAFLRDYVLNHIVVSGEISNLKESRGNYYFNLKDDKSYISCILFSNYITKDMSSFGDGVKVNVTGSIRVYEKNGTYSIYVTNIEVEGLGEYYIKYEALKKKLLEMGMFDKMYKKEIPKYSNRIGIVTAKNGAAIRDIEKTIRDKNPYAEMILYPCKVQGEDAQISIINGIKVLDELGLDVIIIGRGGGSIEDLYAFNDEKLAYTIFSAKTPIISAVGHEINESICDLVSDLRVATPTAAGEKATFSYYDLMDTLDNYYEALYDAINNKLGYLEDRIQEYELKLDANSPISKLENYKTVYKLYDSNLKNAIKNKMNDLYIRYNNTLNSLKSYNILDKFDKGFSLILDSKGNAIKTVNKIKEKDIINIQMKDGKINAEVKKILKR